MLYLKKKSLVQVHIDGATSPHIKIILQLFITLAVFQCIYLLSIIFL